jgi:hypothetical protein
MAQANQLYLQDSRNPQPDTVLTIMFCSGFKGDTAVVTIDTRMLNKLALVSDPLDDNTNVEIHVIEHPLKGLFYVKATGESNDTQLYRKGQTIRISVGSLFLLIELTSELPKFCLVDKYPDRMGLHMLSHRPLFD